MQEDIEKAIPVAQKIASYSVFIFSNTWLTFRLFFAFTAAGILLIFNPNDVGAPDSFPNISDALNIAWVNKFPPMSSDSDPNFLVNL